jgi:hypothetical protein
MSMEILKVQGHQARIYQNDLANLRLQVFFDYPYLYEVTLEYEKKYLETYFQAQYSFVVIV